jgi:hypothetical protein
LDEKGQESSELQKSFKTIGKDKNFSYYANTLYRPESTRLVPESAVQSVEVNLCTEGEGSQTQRVSNGQKELYYKGTRKAWNNVVTP